MARSQSDEHLNIVFKICKMFGVEWKEKGLVKGGYYPDIIVGDVDVEVESLNKIREYKIKSTKWDKKRKKVLVVYVPKEIIKLFDAVTFWQCDKTFKQ